MSEEYRAGELGTGFLGVFFAAVVVWFLYLGRVRPAVAVMVVMAVLALGYAWVHVDRDTGEES